MIRSLVRFWQRAFFLPFCKVCKPAIPAVTSERIAGPIDFVFSLFLIGALMITYVVFGGMVATSSTWAYAPVGR